MVPLKEKETPAGTLIVTSTTGVTLEACLNSILFNTQYTFKKSGESYLIGKKNDPALHSSRLFSLRHLMAESVSEKLGSEIKGAAEITVIKEHNALLIKVQPLSF